MSTTDHTPDAADRPTPEFGPALRQARAATTRHGQGRLADWQVAAVVAEYDRLRAELAETRTVGDALAAAVTTWLTQGPDGPMGKTMLCPLVDVWNEVRGDAPAPAPPPANPKPARPTFRDDPHPLYPHFPARGPGAIEAALDRLSRYGSGAEVHDLLVSARAELEHLIPAGPLLERFPTPAVELPATLSSADDVAAGSPPQFERGFYRLARDISIKSENWHLAAGTEIEITHVVRPSQDYAVVSARRWPARVVPFAVLAAAGAERIEAARGGSR